MHSFLLVGQSNAAGRGLISEAEPLNNDKIYVLRNGRWRPMFRPINPDRSFSGVSLAENFSRLFADKHGVEVGIIPCAEGNTSISEWQKGEVLFDNAIFNAKLAMRTSTLKGILWHQGEADCGENNYPCYLQRLEKVMSDFRKELGANLPIIVGGLGEFLKDCPSSQNLKNYHFINDALINFVNKTPFSAYASSKGLTSNSDVLHFNTNSVNELGKRYFEAYESLIKNNN